MDIRMPVMDGLRRQKPSAGDAAARRRNCAHHRHDGRRLRGGHPPGRGGRNDDYVTKPIEPDKLMNVLRKHLK
jgi:CheY-like chemotaxis protein